MIWLYVLGPLAWAFLGALAIARSRGLEEAPPVEEMPYLPNSWQLHYREYLLEPVTPDRPWDPWMDKARKEIKRMTGCV